MCTYINSVNLHVTITNDIFLIQWDEYYTEIEPLAANIPYMVCPGNHETDWPNST